MKRHGIWYKRELFKNHFKSYKNWDDYNFPSGDKQIGRYKIDAIQCKNPDCSREGMFISEHEAFYYFASQSYFKKIKDKLLVMRKKKKNSIYVCPFCGGNDVSEI